MRASPGQVAWAIPELLELELEDDEDEELEDEELEEDELDDDELDEELDDDEELVGFPPPQPTTVSDDSKQAPTTARFTVNMLFIQFLSLLLDMGRVSSDGRLHHHFCILARSIMGEIENVCVISQNICAISQTKSRISICIRISCD